MTAANQSLRDYLLNIESLIATALRSQPEGDGECQEHLIKTLHNVVEMANNALLSPKNECPSERVSLDFKKEMVYTTFPIASYTLAKGSYRGLKFLVVNVGGHNPCGYVNVKDTPLNGKPDGDLNIDCHGGLTFSEVVVPCDGEKGWWIGWDYLHLGDYDPRFDHDAIDGKKHTTEEVIADCLKVIDQVIEESKRIAKWNGVNTKGECDGSK